MNPDWYLVKKLLLWKWERRKLNKSLSKTLVCIFYLFMNRNYVGHFPCIKKNTLAKSKWWMWWIPALLSYVNWDVIKPMSFCWIYIVISFFLMETLFKRLSVFINNRGSLLLFSKEVHWEAKYSLNVFTFSTIFIIVSSDIRLGATEGILMLFRKLFKMIQ